MSDFETTVYKGQVSTEVWAAATVELYTEDVKIFHSIDELFNYFKSLKCNVITYFHNLKFDGSFWLSYLMVDKQYKQAYYQYGKTQLELAWKKEKEMENGEFKYSISSKGMWYTIIIKTGGYYIEIRDSLKLLPFSVKRIGESFKTKHKKLDMEYTGFRYAGCTITDDEKKYIANDVLVVKEALEIMFEEGHTSLTIGSCCLSEYKNICKTSSSTSLPLEYEEMFPNLYSTTIGKDLYGQSNVGEYIRRSYRGGWCYAVPSKTGQVKHSGTTADVNSLYPSMMHSESGNRYPIGLPKFWKGDYIPDEAIGDNKYYFVRLKTRFYIKKNMLPFIQIKTSFMYNGTEMLESSDVKDPQTGEYYTHYTDLDGNIVDTRIELTMTMTDYQLFKEHYDLVDCEILDGCWFYAQVGIFDEYIDKYKTIKMTSKGAKRELAKLFLNNLYGKMASSTDSSFKVAYLKEGNVIGFIPIIEHNKEAGYIPVGSAITSYARNFTIRAAQANYYGSDKCGFIYADTDSIHCDLEASEIKGIKVDDNAFCCWKLESCWDVGIFTRQKTYIEHVTHENLKPIDTPFYNIKCAGMPDRSKELFEISLTGKYDEEREWTEDEKEFLFNAEGKLITRSLTDFKVGLKIPDKLMPKRILGGIVLNDTWYEMR